MRVCLRAAAHPRRIQRAAARTQCLRLNM
jgi:hypothetical protein